MVRLSRRLILWVCAVCLGCIVLAAVGLAIAVAVIDPNRFKGRIAAAVQQGSGRQLDLRGDLQWRVFPWLVVTAGEGALGNPADWSGGEFAHWQSLRLGVKLLPLLHREIIVDSVRAQGMEVHLQRDARGRVNWRFDSGAASDSATTPLQVDAIALRAATLRYDDAQSGSALRLDALSLDAALPAGNTTRRFRIETLALAAALQSTSLGAAPVAVKFAAAVFTFDVDAMTFSLPRWQAEFGPATLSGQLEGRLAPLDLRGALDLRTASLRSLLTAGGIAAPITADPTALGRFELAADLRYLGDSAELGALRVRLDDTSLQGSASLPSLASALLRFDLQGDRIDLDRYLEPADIKGSPLELPLTQLKALQARGELRLQQATLAGAVLTGVKFSLATDAAPP